MSRPVVSMAAHLMRVGIPPNEREAVRALSDRYRIDDVVEFAGRALELARDARAGVAAGLAASHRLVDGAIPRPRS